MVNDPKNIKNIEYHSPLLQLIYNLSLSKVRSLRFKISKKIKSYKQNEINQLVATERNWRRAIKIENWKTYITSHTTKKDEQESLSLSLNISWDKRRMKGSVQNVISVFVEAVEEQKKKNF